MEGILFKLTIKVEGIFKIITIPDKMPSDILKGKKLSIGFDPNLFTEKSLFIFFRKNKFKFKPIFQNLIDEIWKRKILKIIINFIYCQIKL